MVQWLGSRALIPRALGSIPGQGTKIPQAAWRGQKETNKKEIIPILHKTFIKLEKNSNLFYGNLIPESVRDISFEHRCQSPQENNSKPNSASIKIIIYSDQLDYVP